MAILRWWTQDRFPVVFGLGTGIAWGLASAGSSVPRGFVVEQGGAQSAYVFDTNGLIPIDAAAFLDQYYTTVVQVFATYFVVLALAGWVTWQWVRHRQARGRPVRLVQGTDRYLIGVLLGGSGGGLFFAVAQMDGLFRGAYPTFADVVVGVMFIILPAYASVALFFLWLRRKRLGGKPAVG